MRAKDGLIGETEEAAPEGKAPRAVCTHTRPRSDNHHPRRRQLRADRSPRPVHTNAGRRGRQLQFGRGERAGQ
jgi:hypothetical protein